jgi:hypothetical protein
MEDTRHDVRSRNLKSPTRADPLTRYYQGELQDHERLIEIHLSDIRETRRILRIERRAQRREQARVLRLRRMFTRIVTQLPADELATFLSQASSELREMALTDLSCRLSEGSDGGPGPGTC